MSPNAWAQLHAAIVHFPISLTVFALCCDAGVMASWSRPLAARLRTASNCALGMGALASLPAVFSGLVLTRGDMLGQGALRWHHVFIWPTFTLLVAAAVWRWLGPEPATRPRHLGRIAAMAVLVGLMSAVGHWGGQLALAYP